ncbi:hypothetical protein AB9K41_26805, partial [Cribrihabitans sp. XS_ASV171]
MIYRVSSSLALAVVLATGPAHATTEYTIVPAAGGGYDMVTPGVPDRAAFWCAAGRYVLENLRYSGWTQIMLVDVEGQDEILPDTLRARFVVNPRRHGLLPTGAGANMNVLA